MVKEIRLTRFVPMDDIYIYSYEYYIEMINMIWSISKNSIY